MPVALSPSHRDNPKFPHTFPSIPFGTVQQKSGWEPQPWWNRDYEINLKFPTFPATQIYGIKLQSPGLCPSLGMHRHGGALKVPIKWRRGQIIPIKQKKRCHTGKYKVVLDHRGKVANIIWRAGSRNRRHLLRSSPGREERETHSSHRNSLWKSKEMW